MNNTTHKIRPRQAICCLFSLFFVALAACSGGFDTSVVGSPTVAAAKVDTVLCNAGSPACGTGQALYDLSKQYNIDDAVALAFFKHESQYGTLGMARATKSLGNIGCEAGYDCYQGFASFTSWVQGYRAWYELISGPMYVGSGLTTVSAILAKYDPAPSDDEASYVSDVEQSVSQYRS
jgi:Mannosyl-glycoprotein endo-beta-N-acetylglucosaminidase